MLSNYKSLKNGYGGVTEGYAAPATAAPPRNILCKGTDKKYCNICDLRTTGAGNNTHYYTPNPPDSYRTNEPRQDWTTYQLCNYNDFKYNSCNGKHFCNDKYIYYQVDVDGLTVNRYSEVASLAECYNKIDYKDKTENNRSGEKGVVYDTSNKMCYTIKDIPNMDPARLKVSWAISKQPQKPYVNESAYLVIRK
jgi:hypothetical protein